jgi:hypothetical protein
MKRRRALAAAAIALALGFAPGCARAPDADGPLRVTDARIRTPVPGQDKTAAYLTIENTGAAPFVLTSVASPRARAIEIHEIRRDGDRVQMRRIPELTIGPGATVRLEPGGLHLMVFGVAEPLEPFTATLIGADGARIEVPFTLVPIGGD